MIRPVMERIATEIPDATGFIYGNGEAGIGRTIRKAQRARIRGYYRPGQLPALLARDHVGIAIFTSIWPEAYGLVVDECLSLGLQVVAFDHGAVGERLKSWSIGRLVPPEDGADGLARAVADLMTSSTDVPMEIIDQLPRPEDFLSQLCRKAGLPAIEWKKGKLKILTYQVQYFEEEN